jgi:predicted hydrocarbon binding protein
MKAQKQVLFNLELQGDEVKQFKEALRKVVNVESAISPNVLKVLDDKETKLLNEIYKTICEE